MVQRKRIRTAAWRLLRRLRQKGAEGEEKRVSADADKEAAAGSGL
jgi:hypothetical protein